MLQLRARSKLSYPACDYFARLNYPHQRSGPFHVGAYGDAILMFACGLAIIARASRKATAE